MQIQQSRLSVESSTSQAILNSINDGLQNAASSAILSDLLIRGQCDIKLLSDKERNQFIFWFLAYFRIMELAYHHHLNGNFKESIWEGHARHTQSLVKSPGVQRWWNLRKNVYSKEFKDFIDGLASEDTDILAGHEALKTLST